MTPLHRALRTIPLAFASVLLAACSSEPATTNVLQPADTRPNDLEYDPALLIDTATLTDFGALGADRIQAFFVKTAYGNGSFLETYQSNGTRASDAVARAAATYKINPILLLARLQVAQGLIGERNYPFPPARVEYVFQCGCSGRGACDPSFAGLDRQLDCYAGALRQSLDEIRTTQRTTGGWGPGQPRRTLDNVVVTPTDDGTAALYQYEPVEGKKAKAGNWLLWNVFQNYAFLLDYAGPIGEGAQAWVGEACVTKDDCALDGSVCVENYPGGMCTVGCVGVCEEAAGKPPAFCGDVQGAGFCLATCDPAVTDSCGRAGYVCKSIAHFPGTEAARAVCIPQ